MARIVWCKNIARVKDAPEVECVFVSQIWDKDKTIAGRDGWVKFKEGVNVNEFLLSSSEEV